MTKHEIDLTADVIDVRDLIERFKELDSEMPEEHAQNWPDLGEWRALESILADLKGYGGDEQWRGDWYPATLIRNSYFTEYAEELVRECYDLKELPAFVHIDWEATAREVQMDYSAIDIDGVIYLYR